MLLSKSWGETNEKQVLGGRTTILNKMIGGTPRTLGVKKKKAGHQKTNKGEAKSAKIAPRVKERGSCEGL